MGLSIQLAGGQTVLAYENASGVWFETADEAAGAIETPVLTGADRGWIGLETTPGGGFALAWASGGVLYETDYSASGQVVTAAHPIAGWTAPPAAVAFTSAEATVPAILLDGDQVQVTIAAMNNGRAFTAQLTDPSGAAVGQAYVQPPQPMSDDTVAAIAPLATGGYALYTDQAGALLPGDIPSVALFDAQGDQIGSAIALAGPGQLQGGAGAIAGLADGGFVVVWPDTFSGNLYLSEYGADGSPVGPAEVIGHEGPAAPQITAYADGLYQVTSGNQTQTFTEAHPALGATGPAPPAAAPAQSTGETSGETFQPSGSPVTLTASAGWTSAAVLSNGTIAIVSSQDGGYGSHVGAEQTYDGSGNEIASTALMGYAAAGQALTPEVTALAYGFYQVNYAGSSDFEVYNAANQHVLEHNAYTSATAAITPLAGGGYVQTDPSQSAFAVFDADANIVAYDAYATGSPGDPAVHALPDGDFVFTYTGSREIETYDASGHLLAATSWGDAVDSYAMGFAPIGQSGFLGVWVADLAVGPGYNPPGTELLIQAFASDGTVQTRTANLAQDLDPWHTQFALQAHADSSVAVLWSQGGAAWGAEYANGAVGPAFQTGVAEALSDMHVIQLPGDTVGLAWLQNGDAWAEIFDPSTGAVQRQDLGASSGDLTTVHALATAAGGLAVSWHQGSAVEGAILNPNGGVSGLGPLAGDLIGVDASGHAVTLHASTGGPVLQSYALHDGLFWVA